MCHLREDVVVDLLADLLDVFLANVDEALIQALALNQEHAHAQFKRSLIADLLDGVLVVLDFFDKFLTFVRLLV